MHCFAYTALSYNGFGPARTFQEVIGSFDDEGLGVTAFVPRLRRRSCNDVKQVEGLPWFARYLPWSYVAHRGKARAESLLLAAALAGKGATCVYAFPGLSLEAMSRLAAAGIPVVREMTNLHEGTARRILSHAYEMEGLPAFNAISAESVELERQCLAFADHVFAPNDEVRKSLLEFGVGEDRIIDAAYGWSRTRYKFVDRPADLAGRGQATALFVGRVSYDKGAHHLLRAWHRAGRPGKLMLAGAIDPQFEARMSVELNHPSIQRLNFVKDLSEVYAIADYFVFPSLAEGGPQVVYEAGAHGLPLVASPMGAGRMIPDADHGIVLNPAHEAGFAEAILKVAEDREYARHIGENARKRAEQFEWTRVSRQRARSLAAALQWTEA
ncbi:MAG: glycosyltransferase family 4 protein [Novosphingobium sp.]|nr:glycosyltransferase family 4 protein [Novosphingobium sp.]